MELAMRSASVKSRAARSGSVAASASATPLSADAFADSSVMELAMRSARSGSVAASASATPLSADAFQDSSVMELAMRSASVRRRGRGRWRPAPPRRRSAPMPSRTRR